MGLIQEENFAVTKSERELLLLAYYDNPEGLTDKEAATLLKIEEVNVRNYRKRSEERLTTLPGKKFTLTTEARQIIEREYHEWRDAQSRHIIAAHDAPITSPPVDLPAQIQAWTQFLDQSENRAAYLSSTRAGMPHVVVTFSELAKQNPDLADLVLEQPTDVIKAGEIALEKIDVPHGADTILPRARLLIKNLPETQQMRLREIRSEHLGKLYESLVDVDQVSDVRPQVTNARFECPSCGVIIPVLQLDTKFKEPTSCTCGRKGRFKLVTKELADAASIIVREPLAEVLGQTIERKTMRVILLGKHLTMKRVMDYIGYGKQIRVVYVPAEVPVILKTGGQSTRFDLVLNAVYIEVMDEYQFNLHFTKEEEQKFKQAAASEDFLTTFSQSAYHNHHGEEELKLALAAQLVADNFEDGRKEERLHILIAGDPGTGKSQNLMARTLMLAPICERVVGKGATVPGLTARSDKKDEFTGQYLPEPGVLPKAHKGIVIVDELDKMSLEAQPCLNEATSDGTVTIAKAGSHLTMPAGVSGLFGANPSRGRYDPSIPIFLQLQNIDETVRDRCIVFPVFDQPERVRDAKIADKILGLNKIEQSYDDTFLKRFIVYARARVRPKMRAEEAQAIKDFFVDLRASNQREATIGTRQIPKLRALTLLFAKLRLREETTPEDFTLAKKVITKMLKAFGVSEANLHASMQEVRRVERATPEGVVLSFVKTVQGGNASTLVAVKDVLEHASKRDITETHALTAIATLRARNILFEPRAGYLGVLE